MGHCVLIIDDEISTRTLLSHVLQTHGYDTITAQNGADGVRRLVDRAPCVIVLDSEMPGMDGHDFHEVQKVIAPDVPIICITGASNGEQAACRVRASSAHFKPLDLDALCRTVAHFCDLPHAHGHTALLESALEHERSAGRQPSHIRWGT
jgi:DNA-binding NtrC family response regulator